MAAAIWVLMTVIAEIGIANSSFQPLQASAEAQVIDEAFDMLMVLGAPVFTFVVTVLIYSVLRFRSRQRPDEDGPPIHTSRAVTLTWLGITSGLAVLVIFNPGLKGMNELMAERAPELVVEVTAEQWQWDYAYPQYGLEVIDADELVLPVDRQVKLEITSRDVIHAFWVPAFRLKADAVPGLISELYVTPTLEGTYADDINLRVQCAELCGTGHPRMRTRLRVVEAAAFEAWVSEMGGAQP